MKRNSRILLAVSALALGVLACQAVLGGGNTEVPPTQANSGGNVIYSDDFSSEHWGTGTDADSSIEYANGALQMIVYTTNYFVWSTPDDTTYQNVHLETTVTNNDTDSTTAFGIMCDKQETDGAFYYFAITPAGQYAIAKSMPGENDVFLTNDDKWGTSDLITHNAASYRIGADCGNGTLTLYVNGQQIDSATDSSYTGGSVALLAWSGEESTNTNISFDNFEIRELP